MKNTEIDKTTKKVPCGHDFLNGSTTTTLLTAGEVPANWKSKWAYLF